MNLIFSTSARAESPPPTPHNPSRVINLVDYIGTDYKGAVGPDGQVLKPAEFQEMQDFCAAAIDAAATLELPSDPARLKALQADLAQLQSQIVARATPDQIATHSAALKREFIQAFGVATWPRLRPVQAQAQALFQTNCASCHGLDGRADTPAARQFNPPPRPFASAEVMESMSPFKAFNVMTFGVEGTAMPSFQQLSDQDRWNLAFHLAQLRFSDQQAAAGARWASDDALGPLTSLKTLATSTDGELLAALARDQRIPDDAARLNTLAWLRRVAAFTAPQAPLQTASSYLQLSVQRYRDGDDKGAFDAIMDSYLEGVENAEASLGAIDRNIVSDLEVRYSAYQKGVKDRLPPQEVAALGQQIQLKLDEGEALLSSGSSSAGLTFAQSFAIIAREGLEAAFLIAALLAFLGKSGHAYARRYIHLGTGSALAAGVATWWATSSLIRISGAQREMLEGITTTLAASILFYVSYWLFSKSEAQKWMSFLKDKLSRNVSGGNLLTLAMLAFLAVYREVLETVLFYEALYLSATAHQAAFWSGLAAGTLTLVGIIFAIFRFGLKLPLQKFFRITSGLMYLLSFILAGHGLRALQLAGVISYTPLPVPELPLLGIYASLEPLAAQSIVLLALIGYLGYLGSQRVSSSAPKTSSSAS